MGVNPAEFAPKGLRNDTVAGIDTAKHPVEHVSWNDAASFCAKLSQQENLKPFYFRSEESVMRLSNTGVGYRLPTEAEWEFASRAGTTTAFGIANQEEELVLSCWFRKNSGLKTHAVGELKANPFGLYDDLGNVCEWIDDWWEPTIYGEYADQPVVNPKYSSPTDSTSPHLSIYRGGNWYFFAPICRITTRFIAYPTDRIVEVGFRVSLTVDAVRQALKVTGGPAVPNGAKATASKFPPLAPGWFERVSKLPPEEQVQEVAAELKRRNPEWDEKLEHALRNGYVHDVRFDSTQVADIAPLAALTDLHVLFCAASKPSDRLTELSPLAGLRQLQAVYLTNCTGLSDLSALRGLTITDCSLDNTSVTDLMPLAGMPILYVELSRISQLTDLSPLKGAPLSSAFSCQRTGIRDLSPLRDSQVKQVVLHDNQFDPDIVCGWPLKSINFNGTMLSVPREKLLRLQEIKTLETIDGKPVAEFWKEFDK